MARTNFILDDWLYRSRSHGCTYPWSAAGCHVSGENFAGYHLRPDDTHRSNQYERNHRNRPGAVETSFKKTNAIGKKFKIRHGTLLWSWNLAASNCLWRILLSFYGTNRLE